MKRLISLILLVVMLSACSSLEKTHSEKYTISYCSTGDEPVWIEKVKFDDYPVKSGGGLIGGWKRAMGMISLFPTPSVPKQVYIYWFNYRQQVFYEVTVPIQKNAAEIMYNLPQLKFSANFLVTGVKPDGTAVVWVTNGSNAKFSTWVEVGRAQGTLAPGDPESRRNSTESLRRRGKL